LKISTLPFLCMFAIASPSWPRVPGPAEPEHFHADQVDRSVDPCEDFEKFVCNRWKAANPIPGDESYWDTTSSLNLWNLAVLRDALQTAAVPSPTRSAVEQKIGDFWASCIDQKAVDAAALADLRPQWRSIEALSSKADLAGAVAQLHRSIPGAWASSDNQTDAALLGVSSMQDFDDSSKVVLAIDQGGLSLPGRDFYLKVDSKSVRIRSQFEGHVGRMLALAGAGSGQAARDARTVLQIESELAAWQMDNVTRRDPSNQNNKMSIAELRALTPAFDWNAYLAQVDAPATEHFLVLSPQFLKGLQSMLEAHSLGEWKAYMRWQLVHGSAPFLSRALSDENFDFFQRTLKGVRQPLPRWRRCVKAADSFLGEALGKAYVERAFPAHSKRMVSELVRDVEDALAEDFQQLDWISPATRQEAARKLAAIEDKIGYPDRWRDYAAVAITRDSYLNNVHQATAFEFARQLAKVGKPVDRDEWLMTPPTINAYYDAQLNTINFPAGILQPPQFEPGADAAVNYGNIGATIGHELTHGFDDEGRKFDAGGNLRDWWTPQDVKAYEERGKCIADQYTQDVVEAGPGVRQDGRLTQGEDTADNGGTRLAFSALLARLKKQGVDPDSKGADGWTSKQRYFLSYANSWCTNIRADTVRTQVLTNPHSIPRYRVNNVVADMPEFWQAFSCSKGRVMVREPACRVW